MTTEPNAVDDALRLADDVRRCLDNAGTEPRTAALVAARDRVRTDPVTVAVVGETNRGKSSLLNSLLGRPGLLAVDHRASTASCVLVRHGARQRAVIDGEGGRRIELDDVPLWTTLLGARQRLKERDEEPAPGWVTIETPSPLLATGLQLVDTPGVEGSAALLTLKALAVDALIVALDAVDLIAPQEVELLTDAVDIVPVVIPVLTKIDSAPAWPDLQADDQELIAREVPALAGVPLLGVSARWQDEADRLRRDAGTVEARELDTGSGFATLRERLRTTQGRIRLLRVRELLQTCGLLLTAAGTDARTRLEAITAADDALVTRLRAKLDLYGSFIDAVVRRVAEDERDRLFTLIDQRLELRRSELGRWLGRIPRTRVRAQGDLGHKLTALLAETDRELARLSQDFSRDVTRRGIEELVRLGYVELVAAYDGTVRIPDAVGGIDPDLNPREPGIVDVVEQGRRIAAAIGVEAVSGVAAGAGRAVALRGAALNPAAAAFGALAVITPLAVGGYVEQRREMVREALAGKVTESAVILDEYRSTWRQASRTQIDYLCRALVEEARRVAERTAEHLALATTAMTHDEQRARTERLLAGQTSALSDVLLADVRAALDQVGRMLGEPPC